MSSGPEPRSLSPMRIAFLVVGLVIISALTYYRLIEDKPERPWRLVKFSGETMGTTYQLKWVAIGSADLTRWGLRVRIQIQAKLAHLDVLMSTYKPQSELSRFNASNSLQPFEISRETAEVFLAALQVSDQSGGAFDITVGPIVNAYGFGPEDHTKPPTEEELAALRERIGYEKLTLDMAASTVQKSQADIYCDLSAIAKGYAVDAVARILEHQGLTDYFIEIGGEIRARGRSERGGLWSVGIEEPLKGERAIHRIVPLENYAMATSGDYRNYYEESGVRISHTIDARTGRPITHNLASVSVFHEQCMMADAYATAMMVLGPDDGYLMAEILNLPALFLIRESDGSFSERATPAFDERFGAARKDAHLLR